jgi:hypothetical protein
MMLGFEETGATMAAENVQTFTDGNFFGAGPAVVTTRSGRFLGRVVRSLQTDRADG